jgi:hypothetical protein
MDLLNHQQLMAFKYLSPLEHLKFSKNFLYNALNIHIYLLIKESNSILQILRMLLEFMIKSIHF